MNETRNETNHPSVYVSREAGPSDLTFRLGGGESGQGCPLSSLGRVREPTMTTRLVGLVVMIIPSLMANSHRMWSTRTSITDFLLFSCRGYPHIIYEATSVRELFSY